MGHKWEKMVDNIQDHIASLNWGYRTALRKKSVKYMNVLAEFVDPHTVKVGEREDKGKGQCIFACFDLIFPIFQHVNTRGVEGKISGARIIIATGQTQQHLVFGHMHTSLVSFFLFLSIPHFNANKHILVNIVPPFCP